MIRVATMPFIPGMLMSMVTTSGRNCRVRATAVCRLANNLDVRLGLQQPRQALAHNFMVIHHEDADLPFEEAGQAHRLDQSRETIGKILLSVA